MQQQLFPANRFIQRPRRYLDVLFTIRRQFSLTRRGEDSKAESKASGSHATTKKTITTILLHTFAPANPEWPRSLSRLRIRLLFIGFRALEANCVGHRLRITANGGGSSWIVMCRLMMASVVFLFLFFVSASGYCPRHSLISGIHKAPVSCSGAWALSFKDLASTRLLSPSASKLTCSTKLGKWL